VAQPPDTGVHSARHCLSVPHTCPVEHVAFAPLHVLSSRSWQLPVVPDRMHRSPSEQSRDAAQAS